MNIYAKEGDKVKPIFKDGRIQNGYDYQKVEAQMYLKEGQVYIVDYTIVENWSSDVCLKEFPGQLFNTVHFEDFKPIDPELISIDHPEPEIKGKDEPNEAMIFIEMCNLYDQMRSQGYDSAHILKTVLSQYSITRK